MTADPEAAVTETLGVGDRVALTFPARGDLVVLARLVSSAISARTGFDIEELEDLRLAVGELCLLALDGDGDGGQLSVEFVCTAETLDIACTRTGGDGSRTGGDDSDSHQLSEQILTALVDEHGLTISGGTVRAWMRKRRRGAVA